jgi:hypothetical protein
MAAIFLNGRAPMVTTRGEGRLHVLWYQNNAGRPTLIGSTATTNKGVTRFIIAHNHYFERQAFFWDGPGEAVCSVGEDLLRQPAGRSWNAASLTSWGSGTITTVDASSFVSAATDVGNATCCYIIPEKI